MSSSGMFFSLQSLRVFCSFSSGFRCFQSFPSSFECYISWSLLSSSFQLFYMSLRNPRFEFQFHPFSFPFSFHKLFGAGWNFGYLFLSLPAVFNALSWMISTVWLFHESKSVSSSSWRAWIWFSAPFLFGFGILLS